MTSAAQSADDYLASLSDDRKDAMQKLRDTIAKNLPKGFEETMQYGMITFVVPHSIYPAGYHCKPNDALPFVSLASQKAYVALHHLGLYGSKELSDWFTQEYPNHSNTKLDMGKGCVRFKKPDQIPYKLVGELMKKITPAQWIEIYEANFKK